MGQPNHKWRQVTGQVLRQQPQTHNPICTSGEFPRSSLHTFCFFFVAVLPAGSLTALTWTRDTQMIKCTIFKSMGIQTRLQSCNDCRLYLDITCRTES